MQAIEKILSEFSLPYPLLQNRPIRITKTYNGDTGNILETSNVPVALAADTGDRDPDLIVGAAGLGREVRKGGESESGTCGSSEAS